jgi:predicted membrane chloride channel (bestrophin family)
MTLELGPAQVSYIVSAAIVGLFLWLLKRAVSGIDNLLREMKAQLNVLEQTDKVQGQSILELSIRLRHVESQQGRQEDRQEQFGRFLQSMGFRRSDGGKGPGDGG